MHYNYGPPVHRRHYLVEDVTCAKTSIFSFRRRHNRVDNTEVRNDIKNTDVYVMDA